MSNKIFEVMSDTDTVLITASESKAYQKALLSHDPWIVEMVLNSDPHKEVVWNNLCDFRKEHMV